ncbi:hypothetical protein DTO207G8_4372 [Paecilomyces variotii]|nr:hypothetical protein DTO195F2_8699 [Paecilomyces variotii]KAJ9253071.1 hypothetical protein DTO207G8_4372 [Paecilomyces variotii]
MSPKQSPADNNQEQQITPFADLMALEHLERSTRVLGAPTDKPEVVETFQSVSLPFSPGAGQRAFGGHVFAQSAYAASKTVKRGFVIHNIMGSFILAGRLDVPFVYTVRHVRDGGVYCMRAVDVRQNGKVCFSCICSFKRLETRFSYGYQPAVDLHEKYQSVLEDKKPEDHPLAPGVDADWWMRAVEMGEIEEGEFAGVDLRRVDMRKYNRTEEIRKNPHKYRQLQFYRIKGSPDSTIQDLNQLEKNDREGEYDNLYACAHLYASDKNSLMVIPRSLGQSESWTAMASLSCTVIFHQHGDALRMLDWDVTEQGEKRSREKWFCQEAWSPASGGSRGLYESRLWSLDGTLLATTMQDSMLRYKAPQKL